MAGGSFDTGEVVLGCGGVDQAVHEEGRGVDADVLGELPSDAGIGHVALTVGLHSPELLGAETRDEEGQPPVEERAGSGGEVVVADLP